MEPQRPQAYLIWPLINKLPLEIYAPRNYAIGMPMTLLKNIAEAIDALSRFLLWCLVFLYQSAQPMHGMGGQCRFQPTCSEYAKECLRKHSLVAAVVLIAGRLRRCHPWGSHGHDPVPEKDR